MKYETTEKRPKKILIFSFAYYPRFIGGAEVALKEVTDRIKPEDIEFDLIALRIYRDLPKHERIGNINVYRVGFTGSTKHSPDSLPWYLHINKYIYPFLALRKANSLNKTRAYDATWSLMANYSGFGAILFKLFHARIPLILSLQEGDPIDYIKKRVRFVYPLFRSIFTKADIVQAISNYLADFAKDMGATCPIVVVPNGVNVEKFRIKNSESETKALQESLEILKDDIVVITTSRLVVKNAIGDVIKALVYLPPSVVFLVLGIGYEGPHLKELARSVGVLERVRFLGFVSHDNLPKYLHISHVFVRPSLSEGMGNSFIEAMAADVPVVATNVGGIPDFLKNKETGLFCGVADPKDIALKIGIYMRDKNLREEIIDNAREMVIEKYDWDLVSKDMREKVFDVVFDLKQKSRL